MCHQALVAAGDYCHVGHSKRESGMRIVCGTAKQNLQGDYDLLGNRMCSRHVLTALVPLQAASSPPMQGRCSSSSVQHTRNRTDGHSGMSCGSSLSPALPWPFVQGERALGKAVMYVALFNEM